MEGTACGVLPLCFKRKGALSHCARHEWVWNERTDVQMQRKRLTELSILAWSFSVSALAGLFTSSDYFLSGVARVVCSDPCYFSASKWRAVGFLRACSLVWDYLKYSCLTSLCAHFHPHWRSLRSMINPPSDKLQPCFHPLKLWKWGRGGILFCVLGFMCK